MTYPLSDLEKLFQEVQASVTEQRKLLKQELDGAWDTDSARSEDVLARMLELTERSKLLESMRERFLEAARQGREIEQALSGLHDQIASLAGRIESYEQGLETLGRDELDRLSALFAEELGKESVEIELIRFSRDDLTAIERLLDRGRSRLEAGSGVRPVDFGERAMEMRREVDEVDASSLFPEDARPESPLAAELEEDEGILLDDEVVDLETPEAEKRPGAPSSSRPRKESGEEPEKPDEGDGVVFVDDS